MCNYKIPVSWTVPLICMWVVTTVWFWSYFRELLFSHYGFAWYMTGSMVFIYGIWKIIDAT